MKAIIFQIYDIQTEESQEYTRLATKVIPKIIGYDIVVIKMPVMRAHIHNRKI